ncbi:Mobile element protein [Streptococcus oralis]|uniref:Mobile element protein n=1 Tax=Streptococcus oralis TaxID=1303 RepID=A0A139RL32_STROR|nr:Mobile element protein [Streptococcus oralis]
MDVVNRDTHKEIIAKLDYDAPSCPDCGYQMKKYDFQISRLWVQPPLEVILALEFQGSS